MQLESVNDAPESTTAGGTGQLESPYMTFEPEESEYFSGYSVRRRGMQLVEGYLLDVTIQEVDVLPLSEAKKTNNKKEILRIIRKYIKTKGLRFGDEDSLKGSAYTISSASSSYLRKGKGGRARIPLAGDTVNELPLPRS